MSPHCLTPTHPSASTSFFSPSHPTLPFPSARIDSPFRPPGHEPPLSPPPPPLPSLFSLYLVFLSLSLFLFKYFCFFVPVVPFASIFTLFLLCFSFWVSSARPLFTTLDRAIYPSIHLTIRTHAPFCRAFSLFLSLSILFVSLPFIENTSGEHFVVDHRPLPIPTSSRRPLRFTVELRKLCNALDPGVSCSVLLSHLPLFLDITVRFPSPLSPLRRCSSPLCSCRSS